MASSPVEPLRLNVTTVSKGTVEFLRFMTGREVRARVVQGGNAEDQIEIRLGNHLVKARLSGQPLTTGLSLFVKVEPVGQGAFRLVVLSGLPQVAPESGARSVRLPPAIPVSLARAFHTFLTAPEPGPPPAGLTSDSPASDFKAIVRESLAEVLSGLGIERGEKAEIVLFDEWQSLDEGKGDGETDDRKPGHEQKQDSGSEGKAERGLSADPPDTDITGWGRVSTQPVFFCVRIRLPVLGVIGLMITSADPGFERASVYILPLRPAVARLVEKHLPAWEPILREQVPGLEFLGLARPEATPRSSVDFSA